MEIKKKILLIDDEPDFTEMMRFILENAGYHVICANQPEDGIEKAKLNPDLIMLDLMMPVLNGHEVCRRLKENSQTIHIPIIMLTSQTGTLDKVEAFNLGVTDFINKAAPFEEILVRIKAAFKKSYPETTSLSQREKDQRVMELRAIIDEMAIRTFFQPIVTLPDRKAFGYEALARGPRQTFFENPLNLFAIAGESNMSFQLDTLCMNLAVRRAEPFLKDSLLFLNADPTVILSEYLKNLECLKGSSIPPNQLCIEISERTYISNFKEFTSRLSALKPMGVMIVIDDLGEGYSSLKAIAELNPEFIKIDMGLVRDVDQDPLKQNLIKVLVDMARKIKSRLIAEGVETEAENKTLLSLDVQYGQGYLFSKPSEFPFK